MIFNTFPSIKIGFVTQWICRIVYIFKFFELNIIGDRLEKKVVGKITHYFSKIGVAVVELSDTLKVGDIITIEGKGGAFEQNVSSMQIEKQNIQIANKGQAIGLKVNQPVKEGDIVYKTI